MKKFEHDGQIYNADGSTGNFLDFSANINPLGISEKIPNFILILNKNKNFESAQGRAPYAPRSERDVCKCDE